MRLLKFVLSLVAIAESAQVILKPPAGQSGDHIAMIFITGAQISPESYVPMLSSVQNQTSGINLWVAVPQFIGDLAVVGVDVNIAAIKQDLYKDGFPQQGKFILAGHSLGSAQAQPHAASHPQEYLAVILMSGPINRKFRSLGSELPVPTLTLVGEVDGLVRTSRVAESVQTQLLNPPSANWKSKFPVVLIQGVNHMAFASGSPPAAVKQRDLKLEVTLDQAHQLIGKYVSEYIAQIALQKNSQLISSGIQWTLNYVNPLVQALDLEGFVHFKPLCDENACSSSCYCGSPWVQQYAQPIAAKLDSSVHLNVQFSPSSAPKVTSHSNLPCSSNCAVSVATDSWLKYQLGDALDTGFTATAADEISAKLVSRSEVSKSLGLSSNQQPSTCSEINQAAWTYALSKASPRALSRFKSSGIPLDFGPDSETLHLPVGAELAWKAASLSFSDATDSSGKSVYRVTSPSLSIEPGKFCKLLSPARALEWLYTDSLHAKDGISQQS